MSDISDNGSCSASYVIIILFILLFILPFNNCFSQINVLDKELSFSFKGSVFQALKAIEKEVDYFFSYDADLFDANRMVDIKSANEPLLVILQDIFKEGSFNFKIIGNQIVIYKTGDNSIAAELSDSLNTLVNIRIEGKILEEGSKRSIPYATIVVKGKNKGVIANNEGAFSITVPYPYNQDTLVFSCMGFKSVDIPVSLIGNEECIIYMPEEYISIQEVIIRHVNPISIISQVLDKRSNNYSKMPYNFTGFYRESIKKRNEYIAVLEAVVEGYKSRYTSGFGDDQVKLVKGRKIIDNQNADSVLVILQAGLKNILQLDLMKNLPEFLDESRNQLYTYHLKDIMSIEGEDVYLIGFTPKPYAVDALYKGCIYIDEKTKAVRSIEFQLIRSGLDFASSSFILKKPRGYLVKLGGVNYTINYMKSDDRFYINYIRSELELKIRKKKALFNNSYTLTNELVITSMNKDNAERIPFKEAVKASDVFKDQIKDYDRDFWGDYNYIPPEEPLLKAIDLLLNNKH